MKKKILITGATDGIGLATAKQLASQGHHLLIHGRNSEKLATVKQQLLSEPNVGEVECYTADLSKFNDITKLIQAVTQQHSTLDVLINNGGVFKIAQRQTDSGLDVRFMVNTIAPYLLMKGLTPLFCNTSRVVNLSSAAQAPVEVAAMQGKMQLDDMSAYAQSKLALTCWSHFIGVECATTGPMVVAVNPGSMLNSKMVNEGFGVQGNDIEIGANILVEASLTDRFNNAAGHYFDNDSQQFSAPHSDAINPQKAATILQFLTKVTDAHRV
ncbi:SDR family NAD(P)-dependent oxidoreductase [Pseudoalteromonas citrea]|nr:SDR family NAD(P)-dependent oxidoreductase [Pseudoalteromonas citrea]